MERDMPTYGSTNRKTGQPGLSLRSAVNILTIGLVVMSYGCTPQYEPMRVEASDGVNEYTLATKAKGSSYVTVLTKAATPESLSISFEGKGEALAIGPDGRLLAVALSSTSARGSRIALVCPESLCELRSIPIAGEDTGIVDGTYSPSPQRIDRLVLSGNSANLAAYYWKPSQRGHISVIAVWDTTTGRQLHELALPEPPPSVQAQGCAENVSDMTFSHRATYFAASGAWSIKRPDTDQPDGFVRVWRLADGKEVSTFRPAGARFVRSLCFDREANKLAGWHWGSRQGERLVIVWSLPKGGQVCKKAVGSKVRSIVWSISDEGFTIRTDGGEPVLIPSK